MGPEEQRVIEYGESESVPKGYRRFLSRLLFQAVMDALERREPQRRAVYLLHYRPNPRALSWFKSRSLHCCPERGVSFEWICEQLDLNPEILRSVVLQQNVELVRSARSPLGFLLVYRQNAKKPNYFG